LSGERVERRLAAILAADVVGYSRLMGRDEAGTLARLRGHRRELIDPSIAEHKGRIVKTTGDGILIEFPSVVEAVACAVTVQRGMAERNATTPEDQRIVFRVGVNLGDIIIEDDDILGDGVNIAARLEALAEPGGICVNRVVRDQVRDKLDIVFEDLGEQQVKNIARPVRAFRVVAEDKLMPEPSAPPPALALPDKPSIAVLPFQNMSGDQEQEYFVDGMVEDIITGLSRIKWLFVIARNSTFVYKGRAIDVKQVGRELGVRYVLEGSVRKIGNRVRITGQLIDATNAAHVWAERYDRTLDDIFELQDEITLSVVGAIEPSLRQAEIERARRKRPDSLDAYDLYLRAHPHAFTAMPDAADKALPLLEQAIAIEPDYAAAHAAIAFCHEHRFIRAGLLEDDKRTALRHARIAIATGSDDATALAVAAFVIGILERDYDSSFNAFDRALALSPSSALTLSFSANVRAWAGDYATAIKQAEQSLRLSPSGSLLFLPYVAMAYAHFFAGRFDEAAFAASRAAQANPQFSIPWVLRTAALASLDGAEEVQASAQRLRELWPSFTIREYLASNFTSPERLAMFGEALRRAALPEE
jgi:TolB-like protein/class 3 adenylate cyclase